LVAEKKLQSHEPSATWAYPFAMKRFCLPLAFCLFPVFALAADGPEVVPLWSNGAPGTPQGITEQEIYVPATPERNYSQLSRVHNPSLTVFLPPKEIATGAAVIICPGGAHRFLAIDHEGYDIARWLNRIGVAGLVLKYRLAYTNGFPYTIDTSAGDALRAIQLVRSRAGEWAIDPKRIGIMGFSAGGEVARLASARGEPARPQQADPVGRLASRPDFQVLVYPGRPLGKPRNVRPGAPPAFLVCAYDDKGPNAGVPQLYLLFLEAGVSAELHIYAQGGHGFGMRDGSSPVAAWNERLRDWMVSLNLISKK
jgi:endo-1,4-beta-xylanase